MILLLSSALEDSDDPRGDRLLYAGSGEFVLSPAELKMDDTPLDSISLLWLC